MQNILVTGGAGFIGCNFVRLLLAKYPDYRVTVYDKLTYAGRLENLQDVTAKYADRYTFVQGDICDAAQVEAAVKQQQIDTIVNFAAESHVDRSIMNRMRLSKRMSMAPMFYWKRRANSAICAITKSPQTRFMAIFTVTTAASKPIAWPRAVPMPPAKPAGITLSMPISSRTTCPSP